jgi:hypothetical protein
MLRMQRRLFHNPRTLGNHPYRRNRILKSIASTNADLLGMSKDNKVVAEMECDNVNI